MSNFHQPDKEKMMKNADSGVRPISEEMRRRIEAGLRDLSDPNSVTRRRYNAAAEKGVKLLKPLEDVIARSECLTESDLDIVINV
ncbi:MAG: hypothetical protein B7W98_01800 [Parcubacteria group bacterium 20-58-5]|nr:MAG: hypothetical protein B7W98_01800 [Parcubacteria group bacterium 20-58-5]OYV63782.1 MAG: hypothetical protein B7X03_00450 [Parcubacteria group bacterium 21-58-10]